MLKRFLPRDGRGRLRHALELIYSFRTTRNLLKAIKCNISTEYWKLFKYAHFIPYYHLPNFEAALPRLVASNNVVSFPVPLVPQPLHRGTARGVGWVFGGGIFGQTLAASIILFLAGCFKNFLKGRFQTHHFRTRSYIQQLKTHSKCFTFHMLTSDKMYFQTIFQEPLAIISQLHFKEGLHMTRADTHMIRPLHSGACACQHGDLTYFT